MLPAKVCRWLATSRGGAKPRSLIASAHGAHLFVHEVKLQYQQAVVLELERIRDLRAGRARTDGALTPREEQVLHWLKYAKTNAEIGEILGIAPSTVGKHLERIYPKLGVECRTAAATQVMT